MTSKHAVGIDLGTTFSCIAISRNGKTEVIPNCQYGERLTPSIVFFKPQNTEVSVGKWATEWGVTARTNLVYDTKRLMGRKYDDVYVQDLIESGDYFYKIVRGRDDSAAIEIEQDNQVVNKLPEEIAYEILKYLKESADVYLGEDREKETEAVISVPAHFNSAQRKATENAAKSAGFKVLKLISEPVAAAIHYSIDRLNTKSTLLIFDFGGGTLDVSVVDVNNGIFKVRGIEGDSFLGGRNFDTNLEHDLFPEAMQSMGSRVNENIKARHLLRVKKFCTKLKILLSTEVEKIIYLDEFGLDNTLPLTITRDKFESLNKNLFERAENLITQCLTDLDLTPADIDQVVLVGGSTRIPKVQEMLGSYFGINKLKTDLNPDEAVVLGTAVQAAMLKKGNAKELENFKVIDVTPFSIGIHLDGDLMKIGIKKNTPLPATATLSTVTVKNNQNSVTTDIYEGERKICKFNTLLGSIQLDNLPKRRAGDVDFETIINLDANGILTVEKWEVSEGQRNKVIFTLKEHRLSHNKIKGSLEEVLRLKREDDLFEKLMNYRRKSKLYCYHILYELHKISDVDRRNTVQHACVVFIEYAKNAVEIEKFDELKKKFEAAKQEIDPLIGNEISVKMT